MIGGTAVQQHRNISAVRMEARCNKMTTTTRITTTTRRIAFISVEKQAKTSWIRSGVDSR